MDAMAEEDDRAELPMTEGARDAADDPGWASYPETILEFVASGLHVDLRETVSAALRARIDAETGGGPFVVLTAANPHGCAVDDRENEQRLVRLTSAVQATGHSPVRVDGVSPDGAHREHGVAAALPPAAVLDLALRFGQSAYFRFDGEAFWIVGAEVRAAPMRLPRA